MSRRPASRRAPVPVGGRRHGTETGLVVAAYGRRHRVEVGGEALSCVTRGRRGSIACGDRVEVARTGPGEGVVEAVAPRTNLFHRSDAFREKVVAANVTQVVVVVATAPPFLDTLVERCLVASEHAGTQALIVLNKCDLGEGRDAALARLERYAGLGYPVIPLSARLDAKALLPHLEGEVSVLVGQSGMGKSTLVNALIPEAGARTAADLHDRSSGRHTTTHARLYHLAPDSDLIDCPGMQVFGLAHLTPDDLAHAYPEFRPLLGTCRFNDCRHLSEPECAIAEAARRGDIPEARLAAYRHLLGELEETARARSSRPG